MQDREVVMSFKRQLETHKEALFRIALALFIFATSTSYSAHIAAANNEQEAYIKIEQNLKKLVHDEKTKARNNTKDKKSVGHHPVEKIIRGTVSGLFKVLFFPFTIAQNAVERHAPNCENADQAAQTIVLEVQEKQQLAELAQIKGALAGAIPQKELDAAIADPDAPARVILEIEHNEKQLVAMAKQKNNYTTKLNTLLPPDHAHRRLVAKLIAGISGSAIGWLGYQALHNYLINPEEKKRNLKNQLTANAKRIKELASQIEALKNNMNPEKEDQIARELSTLEKEKALINKDQTKILQNLAEKRYAQKGVLNTVAQVTSSAIGSTAGYYLAKKYTAYQPKTLTFEEQQQYNTIATRHEELLEEEKNLLASTQQARKTHQEKYWGIDKNTVLLLAAAREKEESIKSMQAKKALGRNPVLGTFVRYLTPIVRGLTGNLFPI